MDIKITKDGILVPQATKTGYIFCKWGGCFDASYPTSKHRRGRVIDEGDVSPTLTCVEHGILVVYERRDKNNSGWDSER